jgi:hypothetical protein
VNDYTHEQLLAMAHAGLEAGMSQLETYRGIMAETGCTKDRARYAVRKADRERKGITPKRGRPLEFGHPTQKASITLPEDLIEYAKGKGEGSLSKGLRLIMEEAQEP